MVTTTPVVETTIEVRVMRSTVKLAKVVFPGGHHLVVGGRLVSSRKGNATTPHPDMPAYGMGDFPVPFTAWCDGKHRDVHVEVMSRTGKLNKVSAVRAATILFTAFDADAVRTWIKNGGRR